MTKRQLNHMNRGTVFNTGKAVNEAWDIQRYAVPCRVLENSEFAKLISESQSARDWVKVQN